MPRGIAAIYATALYTVYELTHESIMIERSLRLLIAAEAAAYDIDATMSRDNRP